MPSRDARRPCGLVRLPATVRAVPTDSGRRTTGKPARLPREDPTVRVAAALAAAGGAGLPGGAEALLLSWTFLPALRSATHGP